MTHMVDLMGYIIKVQVLKQILLHVKDYMECGLVYLERLKGPDVGEILTFLCVTFVLTSWMASPCEVGFDGVSILFPAMTFSFEFIYLKS